MSTLIAAETVIPHCRFVQSAPSEPEPTTLQLMGVGPVDGLIATAWALERVGNLASVLPKLVDSGELPAESWVTAAAGGPLGVRDGCAAIPAQWHHLLPRRLRDHCWELADGLEVAGHHELLAAPWVAAQ